MPVTACRGAVFLHVVSVQHGVLGAQGRKPTLSPKMRGNPIIRSEFDLFSACLFRIIGSSE